MTLPVTCLLIAAALLAIGLLGGGFRFRDLDVPKVGPRIRAMSGGLAIVFAGTGIYMGLPSKADGAPSTIVIRIENQLGDGQISEHVRVFVDNEHVGSVYVDEKHPSAAMLVPVRAEGVRGYQLSALSRYRDEVGNTVEARGVSAGQLDIKAGSTYRLEGEIDGTRWQALIYRKAT